MKLNKIVAGIPTISDRVSVSISDSKEGKGTKTTSEAKLRAEEIGKGKL